MERKEPTLSGANHERDEAPERSSPADRTVDRNSVADRNESAYDEPRASRASSSSSYAPPPAQSNTLAAVALVIGLAGVAGAGFLAMKFMEAQEIIAKDAARITELENQLNVTSSESTQSVTALGINLQKIDGEVKKLWDVSKKTTSDYTDKISAVSKSVDGARSEINNLKSDAGSIKQDVLSHKASIDELAPRLENTEKAIAENRKKITDTAASVSAMLNQVKSAEGLASRITKAEEAIDAIDDNRRTINRDLLDIKQQLNEKK